MATQLRMKNGPTSNPKLIGSRFEPNNRVEYAHEKATMRGADNDEKVSQYDDAIIAVKCGAVPNDVGGAQNPLNDEFVGVHKSQKATQIKPKITECLGELDARRNGAQQGIAEQSATELLVCGPLDESVS